MAVKIIAIKKATGNFENPHLGITFFQWVNEQRQTTGETSRQSMYDWVVNKKGQAYIRDAQGNEIYLFGVVSPSGQHYLRAAKDGSYTDDLLSTPTY